MPDRLVRRERRAAAVAAVGDGIVAAALPLLAAAATRDPLAVAGVVAAQQLPWVLTAGLWRRLPGDRRTAVGAADTARAIASGLLALWVLTGRETILGIQVVAFVVGLGEALTDRAESEADDLTGVSARGLAGMGLIGLPLGGFLYEIFPATPFVVEVLAFALAALLTLFVPPRPRRAAATGLLADDAPASTVGLRAALPTAVAAAATSGVAGVLVLFALEDLALGAPAFGLLLGGLAVGTAIGGALAPEIGRVAGLRAAAPLCLAVAAVATVVAAGVADPDAPLVAAGALAVAAAAAMAAAVVHRASVQVRLGVALTGAALRRFHLAAWVAAPAGALAAGWFAGRQSVTGALTAAGVVLAVAAVLAAVGVSEKSVDAPDRHVLPWNPSPDRPGTRTPEEV